MSKEVTIIHSKPPAPARPLQIGDKVMVRIPVQGGASMHLWGEISELGGTLVEVALPGGREITADRAMVRHYEEG